MKRRISFVLGSLVLASLVAGCNGQSASAPPAPSTLTADAVGHNCQMYILDHDGPKAQIHLKGADAPLWFAEIVDAVSYMRDKEQVDDITAIYVSDMAKAKTWNEPGNDNWIAADKASYVIGSHRLGGMGTPDAIPFGDREAAAAFVKKAGGKVVALADIPDDYLKQQAQMGMSGMPVKPTAPHGG